ncbi:MAG TPA: EAL domain-containing protein [Pseudomonas sp.]|nr:EAL domain-containing protein [Pseudomonas sp.]
MTEAFDDDLMPLLEDDADQQPLSADSVWKVLIVDDDEDVHQATKFALANTPILQRDLLFLHAHSASQAIELLKSESDIAVILLDVVMESEDAGLKLVRIIREDLDITEARIILRTGQPGYAPEIDAIRDYDINDYKTKSELSRNRLYTALTAAIRSYKQIHMINSSRRGLDMVIRASGQLMLRQGVREFAAGVITQISALLGLSPEGVVCACEQSIPNSPQLIIAAAGNLIHLIEKPLDQLEDRRIANALSRVLAERRNLFDRHSTTLFFSGQSNYDIAAHIETGHELNDLDRQLLGVFCANITLTLDNVMLLSQLKDHAYNDQLLHIPNRLAFIQAIDRMLAGQRLTESVALIDIDNFSELNAALGHKHGDRLLHAVSDRLRSTLSADSMIARIGGDVFGVLGSAQSVSPDLLQAAFVAPFVIEDVDHNISATIGLTLLGEIDGNGSDAIKAAGIALNRAKHGSRGTVCHFNRDMETETRLRVGLLQDLRRAFEHERFYVVYHPQISLSTGQIVGVEALLRWRTDDGRFISPAEFIPLAENSGLIIGMGEWVMRTACHALKRLERAGAHNLRMAVNVSVMQFRQRGFLETVDEIIAESGICAKQLELEVTESVAMLEADFIAEQLNQLRLRTIGVAVDDFGTGFSSLSYLEQLKVDRLKIDRSFVSQMSNSEGSLRIVETIVQLGHSLQLEVIAEGVEDAYQAEALRRMGCHEAQGFLYAKPLELSALFGLLGLSE